MTREQFLEAKRAATARYTAKHPDRVKATKARNYAKNRTQKLEYAATRREANREQIRRADRVRKGIINPPGDVRFGECPVCLKTDHLACDHDHQTGQVRGWLCKGCNQALGRMGDTLEAAQRLVKYLETECR